MTRPAPLHDPRFCGLSDKARDLFCQARDRRICVAVTNRCADEIIAAGLGERVPVEGTKLKHLRVAL